MIASALGETHEYLEWPPDSRTKTCQPMCHGENNLFWWPTSLPQPWATRDKTWAQDDRVWLIYFHEEEAGGKKQQRNPARVGWESMRIYVNTGFMGEKSRSDLGAAKWPLSISLNHSLPQPRHQWQPWDISALSPWAVAAQGLSLRLAPWTARQTEFLLRDGAQCSRCFHGFHTLSLFLHTGFSSWWVKPEVPM